VVDRFETARLEAFSDGVFAIAITLLVLDIGVPDEAFDDLWRGIGDQWPSYLAYATSFWTIGGLWIAHHALFFAGSVMRTAYLCARTFSCCSSLRSCRFRPASSARRSGPTRVSKRPSSSSARRCSSSR
jgi:Endosomal/lysosomal potassium channel TMEM175